jgi:hypothetical protein
MKERSFRYRSQRYWYDGFQKYQTADGRLIDLHRLSTRCPGCGVGFHVLATISAIRQRNLRRRCDDCKAQGVPVEYRLPPKSGRKRPKGATKGNPRPRRPRHHTRHHTAPAAAVNLSPTVETAQRSAALPSADAVAETPATVRDQYRKLLSSLLD